MLKRGSLLDLGRLAQVEADRSSRGSGSVSVKRPHIGRLLLRAPEGSSDAGGGIRTHMPRRTRHFECRASASSATPAPAETIAPPSGDNRRAVDAAGRMQLIEELCSFEGRGPGTDAERRAANRLAGRLRGIGRRAEVEPTYVHPQYALVHAAARRARDRRQPRSRSPCRAGRVRARAVRGHLDVPRPEHPLLPGAPPLLPPRLAERRLPRRQPRRAAAPDPRRPLRRRPHRLRLRRALGCGLRAGSRERGRVLLGPVPARLLGRASSPCCRSSALRMAGLDAQLARRSCSSFPTVLLIVAVFLLLDIALSEIVPGAYDNASGVAAVLSAAEQLRATSRPRTSTSGSCSTGAEECAQRGHARLRPRPPQASSTASAPCSSTSTRSPTARSTT